MIIFGIDPGVSGAVSILRNKNVLDVFEMPTMIDGKKNKKQVNGSELSNIIMNTVDFKSSEFKREEVVVVVEHVNAMPGQGVTSMFNFGQSFGVIKGICSAMQLPIYFVRPAKWKKYFNLLKTEKDASRSKVIEIFPYISAKLSRKKDSNKADAILLASYFENSYKIQE